MSILFSRLKNLKKQDTGETVEAREKKRAKRFYNFRRFVFSPVGSVIILVFIIVFGVLSFYSLLFLKQYIDKKSRLSITVERAESNRGQATHKVVQKPVVRSMPPVKAPGAQGQEGDSDQAGAAVPMIGQTPKAQDFQIPAAPGVIEAGTPKPKRFSIKEAPAINPVQENKNPDALGPRSGNAGEASSAPASGTGPKLVSATGQPRQALPDGPSAGDNEPVSHSTRQLDVTQPALTQSALTQPVAEQSTALASKSATRPGIIPSPPAAKPFRVQVSDEQTGEQKRNRQRRRQNMEKTAETAALALSIKKYIRHNDFQTAETLLEKLSRQKGSQSSYVLKLKAFMLIKSHHDQEAKELLEQVLDRDPDDLEAGLNIAVVEIRSGDRQRGRQRLERLLDLYPSDTNIERLLNQL